MRCHIILSGDWIWSLNLDFFITSMIPWWHGNPPPVEIMPVKWRSSWTNDASISRNFLLQKLKNRVNEFLYFNTIISSVSVNGKWSRWVINFSNGRFYHFPGNPTRKIDIWNQLFWHQSYIPFPSKMRNIFSPWYSFRLFCPEMKKYNLFLPE